MKDKLKSLGKSLLQALASGLVAWLATVTAGCTTVIVPRDESDTSAVTVTGAIPVGVQFNTGSGK